MIFFPPHFKSPWQRADAVEPGGSPAGRTIQASISSANVLKFFCNIRILATPGIHLYRVKFNKIFFGGAFGGGEAGED